MVRLDQDTVIPSSTLTTDLGSVSLPAEDVIHPSTVATTVTTTFLLASRCAAPSAEEPSVIAYADITSTATMDEERKTTDDENVFMKTIV